MPQILKKIIKFLIILTILAAASYGAYRLYHFVIEDATRRIKKGVSKGIVQSLNPLNWPKKIFGKDS